MASSVRPMDVARFSTGGDRCKEDGTLANVTQTGRPMEVFTPLGKDALLITGLSGHEGISRLFFFQLDLIAENEKPVPFDKLLGQKVPYGLQCRAKERYFNGIWQRRAGRPRRKFTTYRLELVPQFWLLTQRWQSRIFQHVTVPDILK